MKFSLLLLPVATTASSLADSFVTQNQHDSSNSWSSAAEFNSSNSSNASSHNNGRSSLTLLLDAFHHRDSNESTSVSGKGGEVYHEGRVESVPDADDAENIGEGLVVRHDRLEDVEFMTKSGKALLDDDDDDDDDDAENDDKEDDANDEQPITSSKSSKSINQEKQRKKMEAKKQQHQQHNSSKSFKSGESMAPTMMDDLL